jgi:hypothetical protein
MTNKEMSPMSESPATPNVADLFHAAGQCVLGKMPQVDDHIRVTATERPADNVLIGHTYVVEYVDPELVIVHPGIALFPGRGDRWELAA